MRLFYLLLFVFFFSKVTTAQVFFKDKADVLGLDVITGDTFLGSGVSFCDFDNDGWDDLTFATESGTAIKFFKNINGFFVEQAIEIPIYNFQTKQINWVDFDNDGDKDLFVTSNTDGNRLFENTGSLVFIDITVSAGLPLSNLESYGASWGDYDNDGYLDVFISCRDEAAQAVNYLFKNNGNGTFSNVTTQVGIDNLPHASFCSVFFDYNNDGWQDIYVSNDKYSFSNLLYKNNGDGTFTDVSAISGTDIAIDAMTTTICDFDGDGWFDIYVTNSPLGNVFFRNNGDGTFTDIANLTGTTFNSIAWGAVFFDAENDSDLDLYVSGNLDGSNPNLISAAYYENLGNDTFSLSNDTSGFILDTKESYSNAIGDIDNDGYMEIVVNNTNNETISLWENLTIPSNNWLKVKLEGTTSNRDGIGSVIEIGINGNKQYRYTHCGEGYLAQNSSTEIFGLGSNLIVDYVKVNWLSGMQDILYNVNANQLLYMVEGENPLLSVDELNKSIINIYPNPVKHTLFINSQEEIENATIYNVFGQLISTFKILDNKIDFSIYESRIYFLKLKISDGFRTLKVIKD